VSVHAHVETQCVCGILGANIAENVVFSVKAEEIRHKT
jgi:hypothetical protein